jgi:hypothetical protein
VDLLLYLELYGLLVAEAVDLDTIILCHIQAHKAIRVDLAED